jgi:WbqC-like protein family
MIVSINQPAYLPWLGYFHRIASSDLHIVLDHVQFEKNGFTNRNRIRSAAGSAWLTVPVLTAGRFGALPIDALETDGRVGWRRKHWRSIEQAYGGAPYFEAHRPFFEDVYRREWPRLAPLCHEVTNYLLKAFGIQTPIRFSSELGVEGHKDELILALCRAVDATTYLSGALGRQYLRPERFREAGVELKYQDYRHPTYAQGPGPFTPMLAAIDLLFHHGPRALEILTHDQELTSV